MHPIATRRQALQLLAHGRTLSEVSRELGVSRAALREWRERGETPAPRTLFCPRCSSDVALDEESYAALFGYYLGDGCLSPVRGHYVLRVSCDALYPYIIEDVERLITRVHRGGKAYRVRAPGVVVVQNSWKHWSCVFPQHGPGRKHERELGMTAWQWAIVAEHPADFLRGLFHSDGCRVDNWATRMVAGEKKRYEYGRWQLSNCSEEILGWCGEALDLIGVPWRRSSATNVSVSTRAGVALLDELIGPKR
jgi:hypothetical protein